MSISNVTLSQLVLLIQANGPHRFAYTKLSPETGEAVWRWPQQQTAPLARVEPKGQMLDVKV
jgi:hypothetical protein